MRVLHAVIHELMCAGISRDTALSLAPLAVAGDSRTVRLVLLARARAGGIIL